MERFEIALSLNDKQLLIPSMLPKEKPGMQLHQLQKLIRKKSIEKVRDEFQLNFRVLYLTLLLQATSIGCEKENRHDPPKIRQMVKKFAHNMSSKSIYPPPPPRGDPI